MPMIRSINRIVPLIILLVSFHYAMAGTTGKLSGVVIDVSGKEPLHGANVIIQGTTMGAAADLKGQFNILNVPPGIYRVKATMIGYKTMVIENIKVSIDLTTSIRIALEPTVLEAGEEVTVIAERPLVQKDMTSSLKTVGAREIAELPVQTINDVLELQAGIIDAGGLHIRGGRTGEVAYWVDGVATTDVFSGDSRANIENAAVEELQVISGTFNAEYGQAMSGIVNIITKEGGSRYHGQIKGYFGDYVSSDGIYDVLTQARIVSDSGAGVAFLDKGAENPLKKINPIYNGEFSLSGPVPWTGDKLTFFANSRYYSEEGYLYGRDWYKPQGIAGDSSLVPMNPHRHYTLFGKVNYRLSSNFKASYSVNYYDWKNDRSFNRDYKYCPDAVPKAFGFTTTHLFTVNHVFSPRTFYELKVNRLYTENESYLYDNPTQMPHWLVRVTGDTVVADTTFDPAAAGGQDFFNLVKDRDLKYTYVVDPHRADGYVHPDSARAPASYSYYRAGTDLGRWFQSTQYWIGKFDLTSQVNNNHQLKFGSELRLYELKLDSYSLTAKRYQGRDEAITPFTPAIPDISTIFHDKYMRTPRELSAYVQDKMELQDIILNIGLRFDYFNANSVVPVDPTDPNVYDPFKLENKYKNPEAPDSLQIPFTVAERRAFMQKKVKAKMQLSPRLGIAYPITDKGVIHFSYGHFFQIPEFQYLYDSPDFKLNSGGGMSIIGNADLKPQQTTQYEIGLQQEIINDVGVDISLFYRDVRDWVGTSPMIRTARQVVLYSIYENRDYENVRGITVQLEKRYANNLYAKVDYTYQVAEGTYSNPDDAFNAYVAEQEPRINLIPMGWDQRQTANVQLMYMKNNWTMSLIGKYRTGLPYTPVFAKGARVGGTALIGLRENSSRRPDISSVDFYMTKKFSAGTLEFTLFAYVYNLFDQKGETGVFADTGTAGYTTDPKVDAVPLNSSRVGTVQDYYTRPEWYISPRQVQIGFTIGF
jgi:outer membrane receptor protein involved in Fe transport